MANIHDTPITVYRGTDYNPDGTAVPWRFETAFFNDENQCGEYLFNVDENGDLYPTGTVGNAVEYETASTYKNYAEMVEAEQKDSAPI